MTGSDALRNTFDSAAATYHQARPRYPSQLFDELAVHGGIGAGANLLEIGPATGVATEVLAQRGYTVTAIELGANLAAQARTNLAEFGDRVEVVHASFDTWEAPQGRTFDAVVAATAWHWLDEQTKYAKARSHLRPGGTLAFWKAQHVVPIDGDPFFAEIQDVYDQLGESLPADARFPRPGQLADRSGEIEAGGFFEVLHVGHHDWEVVYTADTYIDLLQTFSGHLAMAPAKRKHLYQAIRDRLGARRSGTLRRHWGAVLHVARAIEG